MNVQGCSEPAKSECFSVNRDEKFLRLVGALKTKLKSKEEALFEKVKCRLSGKRKS